MTATLNHQESPTHKNAIRREFVVEVFYDQDCPLCRREIDFLKRRDTKKLIEFTDIHKLDFATFSEKTHDELMAEIHGRLPDGTWIIGVEVFRRLYDAIGWTWIVSITRWPIIRQLVDFGYKFFAKWRLPLTGGRCNESCEVNSP